MVAPPLAGLHGTLQPFFAKATRDVPVWRACPMNPPEIQALIGRVQQGDRLAFRDLFRRFQGDVTRLIARMMGPTPDLEDLVQDVFIQVNRSIGEYQGKAKFSTWLHGVTVNVVLMARRSAKARPPLRESYKVREGQGGEELLGRLPDKGLLPDEEAHYQERMRAFRRCLDRLSDKKRAVFTLYELEGLTSAEVGAALEIPALTVRTRLFYARQEMSAFMREEPSLVELASTLEGDDSHTSSAKDNAPRSSPTEAAR